MRREPERNVGSGRTVKNQKRIGTKKNILLSYGSWRLKMNIGRLTPIDDPFDFADLTWSILLLVLMTVYHYNFSA